MSNLRRIIQICILLVTCHLSLVTSVFALDTCKGLTVEPDPAGVITNQSKSAKFIIDVGQNSAFGGNWKMEFDCGKPFKVLDASLESDGKSISTTVFNAAFILGECVFQAPSHNIIVHAIVNGQDIPQCTIGYNVGESDKQCKLSIDPAAGITSATNLTASGSDLTPGERFRLYLDDKDNTGQGILSAFLDTPSFSGVPLPIQNLSPGLHHIDIRHTYLNPIGGTIGIGAGSAITLITGGLSAITGGPSPINPVGGEGIIAKGTPVCRAFFTVGTPDNPGSFISAGGSTEAVPPKDAAVGAGQSCTGENDKDHPSIKTAIGCVHTNPADFVKDLLTFLIAISGGIAFLMMLLGAFQMISSGGNPETLKSGQDRLTNAVIGLLIIIFAVLFVQILGANILALPGFGK